MFTKHYLQPKLSQRCRGVTIPTPITLSVMIVFYYHTNSAVFKRVHKQWITHVVITSARPTGLCFSGAEALLIRVRCTTGNERFAAVFHGSDVKQRKTFVNISSFWGEVLRCRHAMLNGDDFD